RLAASLRPLGGRFPAEPEGFLDIAVHVPGSPDVFIDVDPPEPQDLAIDLDGTTATHAELLAVAPSSERLLSGPRTLQEDARALVAALAGGGSIVVVSGG